MSLVLASSALLLGLSGGPHCALMCGALQAGLAHRQTASATRRALLSLHIGRLAGYAAAGALVAASVSALSSIGAASPFIRPFWTMLQVCALALGLVLMCSGKVPAWLSRLKWPRTRRASTIRFVDRVPSELRAAGTGACWALIPCGLLQSALIVAALASSAAQGAGVMSAFAVGTSLSLVVVGAGWGRLGSASARWAGTRVPVRLAGALLAASSVIALAHGLGSSLQALLCR